jgi:hypothetical protein
MKSPARKRWHPHFDPWVAPSEGRQLTRGMDRAKIVIASF